MGGTLNIAHRDLKLENLMLKDNDVPVTNNTIKLIDFGLSQRFTPGIPSLTGIVGSPSFIAPEVLSGKPYNKECDVWSCGVIMYMLVSGTAPFPGCTQDAILKSVMRHQLRFDLPELANV